MLRAVRRICPNEILENSLRLAKEVIEKAGCGRGFEPRLRFDYT